VLTLRHHAAATDRAAPVPSRPARALERLTLGLLVLAAATIGFERLEPSLGLTADLRLTNLRLIVALALAAWLLACGLGRRWPAVPHVVGLLTLVWLGLLVVSAYLAPAYQTQSLAFVRDMAFCIAFGWAVYDMSLITRRPVLIAKAFAMCGMVIAVVGLLEAADVQPVVTWLSSFRNQASFGVGELPRIASTLPHPNIAAMLLGLALPLQVAWIVSVRSRWARLALGLGMAIELAALVLTVSRAGMLVTELVLGLMLLVGLRQRQARLVGASLAAVMCLPLLLGLGALREPLMLLHLGSENVDAWYRADYSTPGAVSAYPGATATVSVRVQNTGDRTWDAAGPHPFALSYHLEDASGASVTYDGPRTPLPGDLAPGRSVELQALVVAPPSQGTYVIEWDGVQEAVTWFSWAGTPVARTYLDVQGPPSTAARVSEAAPTPTPAALQPPPPGRLTQWRIALRMARNRPLLGVGPDNFRWVYGDFAELTTWDTGSHANSLYFEWLADTGLLALGVFVWLSWRLLRRSVSDLAVGRTSAGGLRLGTRQAGLAASIGRVSSVWVWRVALAASLTAWFLHGLFDYFYEPLPTNLAFWLVAGLALAAAEPALHSRQNVAECGSPST
jgi:hypothetical protein